MKNMTYLLVLCFIFGAQKADSFSCIAPTNAIDPYVTADAVFTGRITSIEENSKYSVEVDSVFKGVLPDTVILNQQSRFMSTEVFKTGWDYLIFADHKGSEWTADACRGTKLLMNATADLGLLNRVTKVQEQMSIDGQTSTIIRHYFQGDQLLQEQSFANGKKHGLFVGYKLIGCKFYEKEYRNDLLDGHSIEYWDTGDMKMQSYYTQGKLNGIRTFFNNDGTIKHQQIYEMGNHIKE